jgi:hypothetical protein
MPDEQDEQQTSADQSTTEAADSDQQTSQGQVMDESAGQTNDAQRQTEGTTDDQGVDQHATGDQSQDDQATDVAAADAGVTKGDPDCASWFADAESMSKRAAEYYVRNELTEDRGVVEKIEVSGRGDPVSYSCKVHFSDKTTTIEVVVFRDKIIVREDLPGISERLTCWYNYRCPPPNRDLVLTKDECKMMDPIDLRPLR